MPRAANRVKETTTTTGTGTVTLAGAASGYQAFQSEYAVGDRVTYCIAGGSEWEVGTGFMVSTTTLSRVNVEASSNSDALVNFSAGTKDVFATLGAADIVTRGKLNTGLNNVDDVL